MSMGSLNVEMFRAVGPEEFQDIMATRSFRPALNGRSMDGKQFGLTLAETLNFANQYTDLAAIVRVTIPRTVFDQLHFSRSTDPHIFTSGVVTAEPGMQQQALNANIITLDQAF